MRGEIAWIFWDLDNTLIDREAAAYALLDEVLSNSGVPSSEWPSIHAVFKRLDERGHGNRLALWRGVLKAMKRSPDEASAYWSLMSHRIAHHTRAFAEAADTLDALSERGITHVLITNGGSANQRAKLAASGLDRFFMASHILVSEEVGVRKGDAEIFQRALHVSRAHPAQTLMVGDHPEHDILGAHRQGLGTCWLSHGQPWPQHLSIQPDTVCEDWLDLQRWLSPVQGGSVV